MAVITLTGDNDFARREALRALTRQFIETEGDLALERIDGEEAEFARIEEALTSLPFLSNKKMVVLSSPAANKTLAEHIDRLLTGLPETTELIIYEPKFDKRSSLYKVLKKATDFREFAALDHAALSRWVVETAAARGAKISSTDARYLVDRVGMNQQLLGSEVEKLSLAGPEVNRAVIDHLTEASPQSTIFQLLDAAFAGHSKRAMELYDEQRRMRVEPQQIIAMFAWQLHSMAVVKAGGNRPAAEIARAAKLNPYVVGKTQTLVRGLTRARLVELIDELLSIDRRSKHQAIDLDEALRYFILQLSYTPATTA
jgi:DNA polymerase-3 subunit delta